MLNNLVNTIYLLTIRWETSSELECKEPVLLEVLVFFHIRAHSIGSCVPSSVCISLSRAAIGFLDVQCGYFLDFALADCCALKAYIMPMVK